MHESPDEIFTEVAQIETEIEEGHDGTEVITGNARHEKLSSLR